MDPSQGLGVIYWAWQGRKDVRHMSACLQNRPYPLTPAKTPVSVVLIGHRPGNTYLHQAAAHLTRRTM